MSKTLAPVLADQIGADLSESNSSIQFIDPTEFRSLMVSHRRMVREDDNALRQRGLRDLDTGELFVVDERRLHEGVSKR